MDILGTVLAARIFKQITAVAVDLEGRVLFWNDGAERMYGRSAAEMMGNPLLACFRCEYLNDQSEQQVLRVARTAGKWSGDCLHILDDGRKMLVESEITLLRDEANNEIGFSIVIREARDRIREKSERARTAKRADEARQEWEQLRGNGNILERFLQNLPVCAYVKDEKGRYLFCNRATRDAVPATTDYIGKTAEELFESETGRAFRAGDIAVLASDHLLQAIETLQINGQVCTFVTVKFPLTDMRGNRFVGGVSVDITDSVRDRETLRRQSALLDLSSNAILMIDLDGKITYWNQGAERMYGWSAAEVIGRDSHEVLKEDFAGSNEQIWEQFLSEGYWEGETPVRTRLGEPITVLSRWTLLRDATGKPIAGMGIGTDVTETKIAFEEMRRAEAETDARAAELRAILDAMPAATFIAHDRSCRTLISSRFACELFRLPHGANGSLSVPVEERPAFTMFRDGKEISPDELPIQTAANTGKPVYDSALTIVFEDGTSKEIFGHAVPLLSNNGEVWGAVGAFIDVTERNRAEEANHQHEAVLRSMMESISDLFS